MSDKERIELLERKVAFLEKSLMQLLALTNRVITQLERSAEQKERSEG